jgi:hypothetical protein
MHIHGQIPNVNSAGFFGISAGDRSAQAQRAAETRRKLLKAGRSTSTADVDPDAEFLVDRWIGSSPAASGDEEGDAFRHDLGLA